LADLGEHNGIFIRQTWEYIMESLLGRLGRT